MTRGNAEHRPGIGMGSTALRKLPAAAGTRCNRQALPADRIGIQQLDQDQQTFDNTAQPLDGHSGR